MDKVNEYFATLIYREILGELYLEPSTNYISKKDKCFCGKDRFIFNCCLNKKLTLGENLKRISKDASSTKFSTSCMVSLNNQSCKNKTIKAHSISKKKNLLNKNLYTVYKENEKMIMKKVTGKVASVFRGICEQHDKNFTTYADENTFCSNFALQQYYRSLCYELFTSKIEEHIKNNTSKYHDFLLTKFKKDGDSSKVYVFGKAFNFIKNSHELLTKPERMKYQKEKTIFETELKNDFTSKNNDFMYFNYKKLNNNIKFLGSCLYSPIIDSNLNFEMFNNIGVSKEYYEDKDRNLLNINVLLKDGEYYLYMSCRKDNSFMIKYINAFCELDNLEGVLNRYSFLFKNSYYFSELIESLSDYEKELLCEYYTETSNPFINTNGKSTFNHLLIDKPLYFTKNDFVDFKKMLDI